METSNSPDPYKVPKVTDEMIRDVIREEEYHVFPDTNTTLCILKLVNGFTIQGVSAKVTASTFNIQIGRDLARKKAIEQVRLLEAYLLRQKLYESENTV